jgi:hypothetical protein
MAQSDSLRLPCCNFFSARTCLRHAIGRGHSMGRASVLETFAIVGGLSRPKPRLSGQPFVPYSRRRAVSIGETLRADCSKSVSEAARRRRLGWPPAHRIDVPGRGWNAIARGHVYAGVYAPEIVTQRQLDESGDAETVRSRVRDDEAAFGSRKADRKGR